MSVVMVFAGVAGCGDDPELSNDNSTQNDDQPKSYDELADHELLWALMAEARCEMVWECPDAHASAANSTEQLGRTSSNRSPMS